jgi:hypothetical protein
MLYNVLNFCTLTSIKAKTVDSEGIQKTEF